MASGGSNRYAGFGLAAIGLCVAVIISLLCVLTESPESVLVLDPNPADCVGISTDTSPVALEGVVVRDAGRGVSVRFSIRAMQGTGSKTVKFVAFDDEAVAILKREISVPLGNTIVTPALPANCFDQRVLAYYPVDAGKLTDFQISIESI